MAGRQSCRRDRIARSASFAVQAVDVSHVVIDEFLVQHRKQAFEQTF